MSTSPSLAAAIREENSSSLLRDRTFLSIVFIASISTLSDSISVCCTFQTKVGHGYAFEPIWLNGNLDKLFALCVQPVNAEDVRFDDLILEKKSSSAFDFSSLRIRVANQT